MLFDGKGHTWIFTYWNCDACFSVVILPLFSCFGLLGPWNSSVAPSFPWVCHGTRPVLPTARSSHCHYSFTGWWWNKFLARVAEGGNVNMYGNSHMTHLQLGVIAGWTSEMLSLCLSHHCICCLQLIGPCKGQHVVLHKEQWNAALVWQTKCKLNSTLQKWNSLVAQNGSVLLYFLLSSLVHIDFFVWELSCNIISALSQLGALMPFSCNISCSVKRF